MRGPTSQVGYSAPNTGGGMYARTDRNAIHRRKWTDISGTVPSLPSPSYRQRYAHEVWSNTLPETFAPVQVCVRIRPHYGVS